MANSKIKQLRINETLSDLKASRASAGKSNRFLNEWGVESSREIHRVVNAEIRLAGENVQGAWITPLYGLNGQVQNALVVSDGKHHLEAITVPGAPIFSLYAQFGKITPSVLVTINPGTAALLHDCTGQCCVACLHPDNIRAVCESQNMKDTILVVDRGEFELEDMALVREQVYGAARHFGCKVVDFGDEAVWYLHTAGGIESITARLKVEIADLNQGSVAVATGAHHKYPLVPMPVPIDLHQNGSSLMHDLITEIDSCVVTTVSNAILIALWVIYSHLHDRFNISPLLVVSSPEKRCGKTNILTLLARLCCSVLPTGNITMASLFRSVDRYSPTLIIDEADTFMDSNKEMIGLLNGGYKRAFSTVQRSGGSAKDGVMSYSIFCPKVIGRIGDPSETLLDRSIHIRLQRKLVTDQVCQVPYCGPDNLTVLQARIRRWALDNSGVDFNAVELAYRSDSDRATDNARPLLAIATALGADWLSRAEKAFEEHDENNESEPGLGLQLLTDLCELYGESRVDFIPTKDIVNSLLCMEDSPWRNFKVGRAIAARDLARILRPYSIVPDQKRMPEGKVLKGYFRNGLEGAFVRYLPPK